MKLTKEKIVAAIIAAVCALGVVDLTVMENSHIKDVLNAVVGSVMGDEDKAPAVDAAPAVETPAAETSAE